MAESVATKAIVQRWSEEIDAHLSQIQGLLARTFLSESAKLQILDFMRVWRQRDVEWQTATSLQETPLMDAFLFRSRLRSFKHRYARDAWVESQSSLFDGMLDAMSGGLEAPFQGYVGLSKKQGNTGRSVEQGESFWKELGRNEALGVWGMTQGLGMGLAKGFDGAAKLTTDATNAVLKKFNSKHQLAPAAEFAPWLKKNQDEATATVREALGASTKTDITLFGKTANQIGAFGAENILAPLVTMGAGGMAGQLGSVKTGLRAYRFGKAVVAAQEAMSKNLRASVENARCQTDGLSPRNFAGWRGVRIVARHRRSRH